MDQKAERNVHNQLVEVTCSDDAGQYFLITPKLLTGLKYQRKMKILIVNNGSYCESASRSVDVRLFLQWPTLRPISTSGSDTSGPACKSTKVFMSLHTRDTRARWSPRILHVFQA